MTVPHDVPTFDGLPRRGAGGSLTALILWLLVFAGFVGSVAGPAGRLLPTASDLAVVPCPPTCLAPVGHTSG